VADAELGGDGVRYLTVRLYRHHGVTRVSLLLSEVREQLVEGFGADATGVAVLEEHKRTLP
jgi:hypothetical protein